MAMKQTKALWICLSCLIVSINLAFGADCSNTTTFKESLFRRIAQLLRNDSAASFLAFNNTEHLFELLHHRANCDEATCECLSARHILEEDEGLRFSSSQTLTSLILSYLNDPDTTCQALANSPDTSLPYDFRYTPLHSILPKVFLRLTTHREEEEEEEHGDEDHAHEEEEEADTHDDDSEHDTEHEDEHFYEIEEDGCPHIECLDVKVALAILQEFKVSSNDAQELFTLLLIDAILKEIPLSRHCGTDEHEWEELPSADEFTEDLFHRLESEDDHHLSFHAFEGLVSLLGVGEKAADDDAEEEEDAHGHRRRRQAEETLNQCYSPEQLWLAYGFHQDISLTASQFTSLCPALIQQIVSGNCTEQEMEEEAVHASDAERYGYGTLAVLIISIASLPAIFIFPFMNKHQVCYRLVMSYLIGLAIGSLAGDAILHLIPEAWDLHDSHGESSEPVLEDLHVKGLVALAATVGFFILESIIHAGAHHHRVSDQHTPALDDVQQKYEKSEANGVEHNMYDDTEIQKPKSCYNKFLNIKTVAWMIIIGDSLHNFVDGLAIGAAFSSSIAGGVSTSIAVLCHELPHEFGDFAVLVNSGFSGCQAGVINFTSACACFIGLYISIPISVDESIQQWILIATAGMFIYIAYADMVPEAQGLQHGRHWILCIILQVLGIATGIGILLILAVYEQAILNSV